jgi:hypothetical protein
MLFLTITIKSTPPPYSINHLVLLHIKEIVVPVI